MARNPYIPHRIEEHSVAFTGTHDNNTVRGWFENEASPDDRARVMQYLGREVPVEELHWEFIRLVMICRAEKVILPMQDILGLGQEARMNKPSVKTGNWRWRLQEKHLTPEHTQRLRTQTETYGRLG